MDIFWKAVSIALITAILSLILERNGKDFSIVIAIVASGTIAIATFQYLNPVLSFLRQVETLADLNHSMLQSLLRILGVGLTGEMASTVCSDSGNNSLGKGIRYLTSTVIFYLSIPILSSLLDIIHNLLEDV